MNTKETKAVAAAASNLGLRPVLGRRWRLHVIRRRGRGSPGYR